MHYFVSLRLCVLISMWKKACNLLLIAVLKVCMYWIWILFLSHNAFAGCTSLQFRVKILIEHAIDLYLTLKATLSNCSKQISFLFIISLNTKEIVISGLSLWIIISEPSAMMNFLFQPDGSAWLLGRPIYLPIIIFLAWLSSFKFDIILVS